LHLPLRYDDETRLYPLNEAPPGQPVLVEGKVVKCNIQFRPRRQLARHIEDGSGVLTLRFFNFYQSQLKQLAAGTRVRAFCELRHGCHGPEMFHPKYRVVHDGAPVSRALADCDLADTLPRTMVDELGLPPFGESVTLLHNPPPQVPREVLQERRHPAWRRVKFDELLAQQLSMRAHYRRRKSAGAPALRPRGQAARALRETLPFELTRAQHKALAEIRADLARPYPMQRLLQGDVGSGKTVVAALAALQCVENGYQVALMAPTEILAEQHYLQFTRWLAPLGIAVVWIAGGLKKSEKKQ